MADIQREFDEHPSHVRIEADSDAPTGLNLGIPRFTMVP